MSAQRKPPKSFFVLILCGWAILAFAAPAAAGANPAVGEARLIDGGARPDGRYAGLRLDLPGEALTYWRDPGDAGVAPTFDFSGSDNLASSEVLYPAPARFEEAGAQAIGYRHEAVYPLRLKAKDASRPISVRLVVDYAVCEKLCFPAHADLRLELAPGGAATPGFETALARVPRLLDAAQTRDLAQIARAGKAEWLLRIKAPVADIFIEAPDGFHVESRKTGEGFVLALDQRPKPDALPATPLRFTVSGEKPVEFSLELH